MANPWHLTGREYDILEVMATTGHYGSAHTARELGLSPATVKDHLRKAARRMRVHSRLAAVLMWDRHNRKEMA